MLINHYDPRAPQRYIYMLQLVEYQPKKFLSWALRLPGLANLAKRGKLVWTKKAIILGLISYAIYFAAVVSAAYFIAGGDWISAIGVVVLAPFVNVLVLAFVAGFGAWLLLVVRRPLLGQTKSILKEHPAIKIAVLGSYGKTTMKELLATVLGEAKKVKATPGNMNVPISHARWVTSKVGRDEDVLIFEYGEGKPGDIRRFAILTQPNYAIITGLAPNHLDHYRTLEAVANDLLSIQQYVTDQHIMMHQDATLLQEKAPDLATYDQNHAGDWKISDVKVSFEGTSFVMKRGDDKLHLHSGLLGRHQVGPLAAVASLAYELGLSKHQIDEGIKKTKPFEHRMQPRHLHGAWIIDDTYNGNLEGIRAGLQLLGDLEAKRKIYVTPGLVDQGVETERVHQEIGRLIAQANPDQVVLMQNSVTGIIRAGLDEAGYGGEVIIEDEPLLYYTNLEHTLAAGDLLIMQNDWTDNYR